MHLQIVLFININMIGKIKNTTPTTSILSESLSICAKKEKENKKKKEEMKELNIDNKFNRKKKNRQINSLEELSKKFISYALQAKNKVINLNILAKNINAKKRRIYDITNVLEGN